MVPTKSYSYYDLDNGRSTIVQQPNDRGQSPSWQNVNQTWKTQVNSPDLEYHGEMSGSPEGYPSSSQSSWDSSEILRSRPQSEGSASLPSPLSVNMTHDQLMNFGMHQREPRLVMKTHPEHRFRYRYDTEMSGTHGSLQGVRTEREKSVPTVELVNYPYEALIRVSLVTCNENDERYPHPHNLFVKEKMYQKKLYVNWDKKILTKTGHYPDPHYIRIGTNKTDYSAKFEGMCIISSKKENFNVSIKEKLIQRELEQKYGTYQGVSWTGRTEDITKKVESAIRLVDVDFVSLCFEAFREEDNKIIPICRPLYSGPIGNAKSAKTGKLKIARINKCSGSCRGGDEIWLLVEKINKKGLVIKFSEEYNGNVVWQACIEGDDLILHHQYAIIFKTPPYRDTNITSEVEVLMRLERTTGPSQPPDYSEPMTFVYEPLKSRNSKSDNLYKKESILTPLKQLQHKRPRTESASVMSAYNFQNKRRPDDPEFVNKNFDDRSAVDIDQMLLFNSENSEFVHAWSKFDVDEFMRMLSSDDIDMSMQKDSSCGNRKNARDLLLLKLLRHPKIDENNVRKLTDQISSFRLFKADNLESKNGIDKDQVEDAASALLSLGRRILENDGEVDQRNDKHTALHEAVLLNKPDLVTATLKSCRSFMEKDSEGNTPLHLSLLHSFDSCTERLLGYRGDVLGSVNVKNNEGRAPIHIAAANDNLRSLRLLIENGADIHQKEEKTRRNALHVALENKSRSVVEYLLQHTDVNINEEDKNGETPLQMLEKKSSHSEELMKCLTSKSLKKEKEADESSSSIPDETLEKLEEVYEILNESGSWRKLADMWNCSYVISHAEEAKNPAKCVFNCAEQMHGKLELEVIRTLLDAINEKKAVDVVDELLARKFL